MGSEFKGMDYGFQIADYGFYGMGSGFNEMD